MGAPVGRGDARKLPPFGAAIDTFVDAATSTEQETIREDWIQVDRENIGVVHQTCCNLPPSHPSVRAFPWQMRCSCINRIGRAAIESHRCDAEHVWICWIGDACPSPATIL